MEKKANFSLIYFLIAFAIIILPENYFRKG
jgi:hypothetical protein